MARTSCADGTVLNENAAYSSGLLCVSCTLPILDGRIGGDGRWGI